VRADITRDTVLFEEQTARIRPVAAQSCGRQPSEFGTLVTPAVATPTTSIGGTGSKARMDHHRAMTTRSESGDQMTEGPDPANPEPCKAGSPLVSVERITVHVAVSTKSR
jgi:hypothetical protein